MKQMSELPQQCCSICTAYTMPNDNDKLG